MNNCNQVSNRLIPFIVNLVLITGFMGCQKSVEEISLPEGNLQSDSPLAAMIRNTATFDGSFDNAIDNSSCIAVNLPVDVVVNGEALTVSNAADIAIVENILTREPFNFDTIQIAFPIQITLSDHSEQTIQNQSEFDAVRGNCLEGGLDDDIECVDFNYPIAFNTYDSQNQKASIKSIGTDQELFQYLSNLNTTDIVTFDYPVSLTLPDGSQQEVSSNVDLSATIENNTSSCDESDILFYHTILPQPFETGRITIEMTDAPFPSDMVSEVNVTVQCIEIKVAGEEDEEEETLLTLTEEEFAINLLDLTNGITVLLADLEIPEGFYDEIRLTIKESSVKLTDETVFDITIPSDKVKVKIEPDIEIVPTETMELLLDFDVSQSFVVQGNPNTPAGIKGFLFKPVVKAANLAETGTLSGNVTDVMSANLKGVQISVFAADTLNTTSFTDSNGNYQILGLLPGDYEITAELEGYMESTKPATLVKKEVTVLDFQLTEN